MLESESGQREGRLILITGGARSGKSAYAEEVAKAGGKDVLFVATAQPGDDEMRRRIHAHRASRPRPWRTVEAPVGVAAALAEQPVAPVVLLDCVTLLVSNLLLRRASVQAEIDALLEWHRSSGAELIAVTNEVGLGIVPDNALARQYRDELGLANQRLAAAASSVVLMVAGIPVMVKP
ncbi:MAG: bifunctional adenosylcobinamide kinase/adenosylcobinamide-phosphate guanylyltransferase [Chloroflexota bacterium]|nr:bifunctional adenosylcobinamide kinase/adenosylcobinamide-phosphate guanylyltransferase [Chloroflexota bacterium]